MNKFNYNLAFLIILLAVQIACGQNTPVTENKDLRVANLKNQADQLIDAWNKNEFEKFADLTHPQVIEKVGGKEKLVLMMKSVSEQSPKIFESFSVSVENPNSLVELEGKLFGVVPIKIEGVTHQKNKVVTNDCFVGVSSDNGTTWKFVSGDKFDEIFPSAKGKLQIIRQRTFVNGKEQYNL